MAFLDFLFKSQPDKLTQFDQYTPQQMQFLEQLFSQLQGGQLGEGYGGALSGLSEMMDPSSAAYQRFSQPYMQQFEQQTIPGIAERFAGAGAQGGALSSSGFGQALGAAGANLQTDLAGMKAGLQQQSMRDIMGQYNQMANTGMGAQPFGYMYQPGSPSIAQSGLTNWFGQGFPGAQQGYSALSGLFG